MKEETLRQFTRDEKAVVIETLAACGEVPDHELTPTQLDARYNPEGNGEHPHHSRGTWRNEVFNDNTLLGYWEWVAHQLNDEYIHNDPK